MRASIFAKSLRAASPIDSNQKSPSLMLLRSKSKMTREGFQMTPNPRREREMSRREREIMRAELIADEMASAVRFLGGDGTAKEQVSRAARAASLSHTVIERLRWRKIKRVPADIADAIREAVAHHNEGSLSRAKHELYVTQKANEALAAQLRAIDPDRYGPEIARLGRKIPSGRRGADLPR